MLKNSMAFVTAEYLSKDEGKDFGEKYRNGKTTLEGNWNKYLEKWSEMITDGVYTKDMVGIDHDQALEEFATGKAASSVPVHGIWILLKTKIRILRLI